MLVDKRKRLAFKKTELKCINLKIGIRFRNMLKVQSIISLSNASLNDSIVKIRNRCFLTSRARGVYAKLKISRIKFREILSNGNLVGFKKSSW